MTYNIYFSNTTPEPILIPEVANYNQEMLDKKLPKLTECEETF